MNVPKCVTVPQSEPVVIGSSVLTFEEIQHGDGRTLVAVSRNFPVICNALQNNTMVKCNHIAFENDRYAAFR